MAKLANALALGGNKGMRGPGRGPSPKKGPGLPKGGKKGFNPMKVLEGLSTGGLLNPEQLASAARALTVLETKPEIHGYAEIAKQLGQEKGREATGLTNLGTRTAGNVSGLYKGLAESAAQSIANQQAIAGSLSSQSANIASKGTQELGQLQSGALGDYEKQLEMRGAQDTQGGAQQALAQAVSAQQGYQQQQGQAAQATAQQQGASSTALLAAMAGAGQLQGAEAGAGIHRTIANRVADSNAKYNTNIETARNKQAEAKASYGGKYVKNILGLREGEQKFKLGEQAVAGEKAALGLKATENEEDAKQQGLENEENQLANSIALKKLGLEYKKFGLSQWEAKHPEAGSNKKQEKAEEIGHEVNQIKAVIGPTVGPLGKPPPGTPLNRVLNTYITEVNKKTEADPALVKKVVEKWFYGPYMQKRREESGVGTSHR